MIINTCGEDCNKQVITWARALHYLLEYHTVFDKQRTINYTPCNDNLLTKNTHGSVTQRCHMQTSFLQYIHTPYVAFILRF